MDGAIDEFGVITGLDPVIHLQASSQHGLSGQARQ
jgi:hypothetical protein